MFGLMRKNKAKKAKRERETIRDYLIRHGNSCGALKKRTRLSDVVVNGKAMSCIERDNLVLFMYKKHYDTKWIAEAFNVPLRTIQKIIDDKG